MLSEEFFSAICGPPLTSNTAIAKDVAVYHHTLSPSYSVKATFKKGSAPVNCLAVSDTHVFAAQHEKAYVHVYSRLRGNQEAFVPLAERIRCATLAGDVLIAGTAEGRILLWETCTGRLISTPPCHIQAVSCVAATPYHLLSGSDDSNVHVWSLPRLLELDSAVEHEPERTLSSHRAAITSVVLGQSTNPDTNLCISASKDKTCIIWNYQAGVALRTLLFPAPLLCLSLDPAARALYVSSEDGSLYAVELLADKPLLGPYSAEASSTAVQITSPFGMAPSDAGPAACLALSYDGATLLSGHPRGKILQWSLGDNSMPVELANLNASVTNLVFVPPLPAAAPPTMKAHTVVTPSKAARNYTLTAQFDADLAGESKFGSLLNLPGFSQQSLENAILSFQQPSLGSDSAGDQELRRQNEELLEIINEQQALYKEALQRYADAKSARS